MTAQIDPSGTAAADARSLLEPASSRTEKGQPVPGHVMVLIKNA